jgi:GH15 family glucan-1,4-alpha-glucosidase
MSHPIEDYAMIGDCRTAALVARDGAIEWLCLPSFDAPACFAKLLGEEEHGYWRIATQDAKVDIRRAYRGDGLILETEHRTAKGKVRVIDFMPTGTERPQIVRLVEGLAGEVEMRMELAIRFEYGRTVPWVTRTGWNDLRAVAGPNTLILRADVAMHGEDQRTVSDFVAKEGQCVAFALAWGPSHEIDPRPVDPKIALSETDHFWIGWAEKCRYDGPSPGAVRRSLATLKALTYLPTGGIVAAPTTSLPEKIGGVRNWDYRFCWLRDSTFCLVALMDAGYVEEALAWRGWLARAVAGNPEQTQILYGIGGERLIPEIELDWLSGYQNSRPVRIGNAASNQLQLDIFGEVADAMYQAKMRDLPSVEGGWEHTLSLMSHLARIWEGPDEGIWEVRGPRQQFVHSKVMAWLAFDRTIRRGEARKRKAPYAEWRKIRDAIHAQVCEQGFDRELGSFVQAYGSKTLDASLLRIPVVGFLPPQDERVRGTVAAIERELMVDGLVLRYRTEDTKDGLPVGEGAFLPCSFWYADNLVLLGRVEEAKALFDRLIGLCNDVGLLAEEYDPRARRMLGNFPQAFSHVALVNTALRLARALREASPAVPKEAASA